MIAFDGGSARRQPTGVGVYVRDLGRALASACPDGIAIFGVRPDGPLVDLAAGYMTHSRYQLWLQARADREARRLGADLVHYTNGVAPLLTTRPFVLTIHDLSVLRYPRYHPIRRVVTVSALMAWAARRAQRILVPSRATADEAIRLLRVAPRRLEVVHEAPAAANESNEATRSAVLRRWHLDEGRYVVGVSTLEPRKNIPRLIAAFQQLAVADPELRLVLIGGRGWGVRRLDPVLQNDRVITTGYIPDDERLALLGGCAAFAYVSLYEGFGLPIVEAMQAGAPVVTSNQSSMPEAAGGAAVLVNPLDVADIARGLREAMSARPQLVAAGRVRVRELTWERAAAETIAVYRAALG